MWKVVLCTVAGLLLAGCSSTIGDTADNGLSSNPGAGAAMSADAAAASMAAARQAVHRLNVTGGFGSGDYAAGQTAHVWAGVRPLDQTLVQWSGDTALLSEPKEWHTTLVMPDRDVALTALVADRGEHFEVIHYTGGSQASRQARRFAPPNPKALLLFLHGTGGSSNFVESEEAHQVALVAIARGYAVVSPEAEEAAVGDMNGDGKLRWSVALQASNVDFSNLNALLVSLRQEGWIASPLPLVVLGMSNGGAMSVALGAVPALPIAQTFPELRPKAAVSYCAGGGAAPAAKTTTPTAWWMCSHDDNDEVSNADAHTRSQTLASRGIVTLIDEHPPSPLYNERFLRAQLDVGTSTAVAEDLRAAGYIDAANSFFRTASSTIVSDIQTNPEKFPSLARLSKREQAGVLDQIRAMEAEHQMYSDWANRTVDFLDAHLAD